MQNFVTGSEESLLSGFIRHRISMKNTIVAFGMELALQKGRPAEQSANLHATRGAQPVAITETSAGEQSDQKRVLIVDDEEVFRGVLRSFVESLGYACVEADCAHAALEELKKIHFPIVISDIVMPKRNGLELLRAIKKRYSDVDVLIVSAYGDDFSPMKIVESGASDFLAKPFNLEQLAARLHKIEMEKILRKKLYIKSITDDLTGLYNRGYFYQQLRREAERARRQRHPLSIIMLDVDGFKTFNDRYGHLKGDTLLKMMARILQSSVREHVDCIFRYGGDEFVVILPEAEETAALFIGNRIKGNFTDNAPAGLTLSVGVAQFRDGFDRETFVNLADKRMYEDKAKSKGLEPAQLLIGVEGDDHHIRCLNCGRLVHWTASLCDGCLADPLKRSDSDKSREIARAFLTDLGESLEDRRRAPRIRISKTITNHEQIAAVCNISRGGLQIKTEDRHPVGKKLEIALPLDDTRLIVGGVVVYAKRSRNGGFLAGVRFSKMPDEDARLLQRFLTSCSG
jgi:diguanylate cyclase (GGDEF)-like protein